MGEIDSTEAIKVDTGMTGKVGNTENAGHAGNINEINIIVRRETTGESTEVGVDFDATIGELRMSLIENGMMDEDASIYYEGKELSDKMTFKKLGIVKGGILQIGGSAAAGFLELLT